MSDRLKREEEEEDPNPLGDKDISGIDDAKDLKRMESFHPADITLGTFHRLLDYYPTTAQTVYRQKTIKNVVPQPTKGQVRRARQWGDYNNPILRETTDADMTPWQKEKVDSETEKLMLLDHWRYEEFPGVLKERMEAGEMFMNKEEFIKATTWRMTNGKFRPTAFGIIKDNKDKLVRSTTTSAFKLLPTAEPDGHPNDLFPKASMETLDKPLRGVNAGTTSLILSMATIGSDPAREIPFYSDHTFLWFVLDIYPRAEHSDNWKKRIARFTRRDGELRERYNLVNYRRLWDKDRMLRTRLNRMAFLNRAKRVSCADVEKVAFVLRHFQALPLSFRLKFPR